MKQLLISPLAIFINRLLALPFLLIIEIWRFFLSPFFGSRCRFEPSCSEYGKTSLLRFGLIKGLPLLIGRVLRCHPFFQGEFNDPVPSKKQKG